MVSDVEGFCNHAFLSADGTIMCDWNKIPCVMFKTVRVETLCGGYDKEVRVR